MRYLFLIYGCEDVPPAATEEEGRKMMQEWVDYTQALQDAGVLLSGDALQHTSNTTTVAVRDGQQTLTDGPFAETREVLGGYYLVDVPDLDTATAWAAKCPGAFSGSIEVRPIQEFD